MIKKNTLPGVPISSAYSDRKNPRIAARANAPTSTPSVGLYLCVTTSNPRTRISVNPIERENASKKKAMWYIGESVPDLVTP